MKIHSLVGTDFEKKEVIDKKWTSLGFGREIALDVRDYNWKLSLPIQATHQLSVQ